MHGTKALHLWCLSVHMHASSDPTRNGTLLLIEFVGSSQCTVGSRFSNLPFTYLSDNWRSVLMTNVIHYISVRSSAHSNKRTHNRESFWATSKVPWGVDEKIIAFVCVRLGSTRTTRWCHSSFLSLLLDSVWLTKFPVRERAGRGSGYHGSYVDSIKRLIFEHHPWD